jgi:hypothetical protein
MHKIAFFVLVILASACSLEERPGANPEVGIAVGNQSPDTAGARDSVSVSIAAPRAAAVGDRIPISVVLQNRLSQPLELHLMGREPAFDIIVMRSDSTVVWRRLASATYQAILLLKQMAPHESLTMYDYWQPNEAGSYLIRAEVPTDAQPLKAVPVTLTIR